MLPVDVAGLDAIEVGELFAAVLFEYAELYPCILAGSLAFLVENANASRRGRFSF